MTLQVPDARPEEVIALDHPQSGLRGFIVVHSTALGQGAGGCRLWTYEDDEAALADALRLAEGMTLKNALAGLPFGGAKAVIRRPEGDFDRQAMFRAFGEAVEALQGRYVTAEDVGTNITDMQNIASQTAYVAGLAKQGGRAGGDPSPWTALGIFEAMKAAADHGLGSGVAGLRVAVQGVGNVGEGLCALLAEAGAHLVVADIDPRRAERMREAYRAEVVGIDAIAETNADIFAPCALGGVLTPDSVSRIAARVICGGANNQLSSPDVAEMLMARNISYVPDYVANAGGIINVSAEYLNEEADQVRDRVLAIGPRTRLILDQASAQGVSPAIVADAAARRIVEAARAVSA
ncbi:Leu/Phe/Val dehydrogenase [Sphingobium vermicomposti]|uniref:Leucine dehydrogenase n=1 Tax=Sphingobium vermicomposti TaxID=529005 RepID=A0A846M5P5_9SPHN|nr:Glu/Leu/Phe/Val dehydrogenase dimerization domain-containing protein [Sphingobium vermicomposti]NIJ15931.1 leucine dehydrogenase [Sphingobium vermicomposti]